MADFLVVDGTPIEIIVGTGDGDYVEIGESDRAFNGDLLRRHDTTKLEWPSLQSMHTSRAAYEALVANILTPVEHTITGTIVGDVPIQAYTFLKRALPIALRGGEIEWSAVFSLRQK